MHRKLIDYGDRIYKGVIKGLHLTLLYRKGVS